MSRRLAVSLLTLVVVVSGCATPHPHVELPRAPSSNEPFDERAKYYKEHALSAVEPDHLFLHGGTRVYWPEDLLPAVDADSTAARAIQDHVEARARVEAWNWLAYTIQGVGVVGSAVLLGGLGAMAIPIVANDNPALEDLGWTIVFGGLIGGGGLMLGALGLVVVNDLIVGEDARMAGEAADRAKKTYPQSLSDRLGVGVNADGIIQDYVKPGTPAPAPVDDESGRDI